MVSTRPKKKKGFFRTLVSKYRLVLIDDTSFDERLSFRLSRINVILLTLALFTLHGLLVLALIVFTPLKRSIPGYSDTETKRNSYSAAWKADSLEQVLPVYQQYVDNIRRIYSGEVSVDSAAHFRSLQPPPTAADLAASPQDSALREQLQEQERYMLHGGSGGMVGRTDLSGIFFFPPVRGIVTQVFDLRTGHHGVDVVTKADEAVKACLNGVVVMAGWTNDGGHVLLVQHSSDLVSVYKHNAVLFKKEGDLVRGGEAIAVVGDSGELTNGPHVHFELWLRGEAIDPQRYMVFK